MHRSLGEEVIISSEYIKVMFRNREGVETIVYELSNKRLGKVSNLFKSVLQLEKKGTPVRKSLQKMAKQNIHPYLKRLVSALVAESQVKQNIAELSATIIEDRTMEIERLTRRLEMVSNFLLLLPHITILIPLIDVFNQGLSDIPADSGLSFASLTIPDTVKVAALAIVAVIILVAMTLLRLRK